MTPGVAGHAGGQVSFRKSWTAVLEDAPQGAGIGEGGGDFVGEIALGFEAEVGGFLAGHVGGDDLVEQLRPEQAAFDSDGGEARHLRFPISDFRFGAGRRSGLEARAGEADGFVEFSLQFGFGEHLSPVGGDMDAALRQFQQFDMFGCFAGAEDDADRLVLLGLRSCFLSQLR